MVKDESKYLKTVDYFLVEPKHEAIHTRLENWARWCATRQHGWMSSPMFRLARSNSRQWHAPEIRPMLNLIDAQALEKAVGALPDANKAAVRWSYVFRSKPIKVCRFLGLMVGDKADHEALMSLVRDGRQMLINRRA